MGIVMTVTVRYFALLRDRAGTAQEDYKTDATTVRALIDELITEKALGLASPLIRAAVNGEFVPDDFAINDGVEIVLIPPVSGG